MKKNTLSAANRHKTILTVILSVISIIYILPVLAVVMNSFKQNTFVKTDTFALPTGEMSAGFDNFIKGMTFGNYPFVKSVLYSVEITLLATFLILLCTSMAAWYIARVDSLLCKAVYFLCVFSMVVPFQMVMFPLSKTADKLHLNTPLSISIVYLGFGAGPCHLHVCRICKSDSAGGGGGGVHRRMRAGKNLLPGGCADVKADHDFRGYSGDHVGVE